MFGVKNTDTPASAASHETSHHNFSFLFLDFLQLEEISSREVHNFQTA